MEWIVRILTIALVVLLAWHLLKPNHNLQIVVREATVDVNGRALSGKHALVRDFFHDDLPAIHQAKVLGYWDGRYLSLGFRGKWTSAQKQRVRNFLLTIL